MTPAVAAVGGVDLREVEVLQKVDHEIGEMALRQPLPKRGRQKIHLLTITRLIFPFHHGAILSSFITGSGVVSPTGS